MNATNPLTGECTYRTPCGFCTKWDKKCDRKMPERKSVQDPTLEAIKRDSTPPAPPTTDSVYVMSQEEIDKLKKPKIKFTLVISDGGQWEALYADGKLLVQWFRLGVTDVLDAIADILPNELVFKWISDEVAECGMPENLSELEK